MSMLNLLEPTASRSPARGKARPRFCPPLRVLVVDDCPDTRDSLRMLLELWGHEVAEAEDGADALESALIFLPDVVLLDIGLPDLDGYQVGRQLRCLPGLENAVLIAATGFGQPRDVARCHEAGFSFHLLKPFDLERLKQLLSTCHAELKDL